MVIWSWQLPLAASGHCSCQNANWGNQRWGADNRYNRNNRNSVWGYRNGSWGNGRWGYGNNGYYGNPFYGRREDWAYGDRDGDGDRDFGATATIVFGTVMAMTMTTAVTTEAGAIEDGAGATTAGTRTGLGMEERGVGAIPTCRSAWQKRAAGGSQKEWLARQTFADAPSVTPDQGWRCSTCVAISGQNSRNALMPASRSKA